MAPVLVGDQQIPVCVFANPVTGISHHGIILYNSNDPTRRAVMLVFRDTDIYFTGFMRGWVTLQPDGTIVEEEWGTPFFFDDVINKNQAPAFLGAVKMGISSSHSGKMYFFFHL